MRVRFNFKLLHILLLTYIIWCFKLVKINRMIFLIRILLGDCKSLDFVKGVDRRMSMLANQYNLIWIVLFLLRLLSLSDLLS
jgi:hypothetical protein